jgi:PAS domain S-box-containing protein
MLLLLVLALLLFLMVNLVLVFLFYKKALKSEKVLLEREQELTRRVYETAILKEIGERIGYSLDVANVIEIICGSLGKLFSYSTASSILISDHKLIFKCFLEESVDKVFIENIKHKMLASLSALLGEDVSKREKEEVISGTVLDEEKKHEVGSFFNIPLVIEGQIVGLINIASERKGLYKEEEMTILYKITTQASDAISKLQHVLKTEKGKLESMVSSMSDGVIMTDRDTKVLVANPKAKEMLGISHDKEVTIYEIVDALTGKFDLRTKIEESIKEEKEVSVEELELANFAIQLVISPVRDPQGALLGSVIIFHDITSQKEVERLREDFTAMIVHDLRAPLTVMRGTSETLMLHFKALPREKITQSLSMIKEESENMLAHVSDLLDLSKLESGKFELLKERSDLILLIEEKARTFINIAATKRLKIVTQVGPNIPEFEFDRIRIGQVLDNLLSNAIKFTDIGKIKIGAKLDGDKVLVTVKDTGTGIEEKDVAIIFNKFRQLTQAEREAQRGTGLGLVIAKGIVEAHGGEIGVKSKIGEGSTFSFTLPLNHLLKKRFFQRSQIVSPGF